MFQFVYYYICVVYMSYINTCHKRKKITINKDLLKKIRDLE